VMARLQIIREWLLGSQAASLPSPDAGASVKSPVSPSLKWRAMWWCYSRMPPQILLSGTAHFARPAVDFEGPEGVPLFPDLQITCSISHQVEATAEKGQGQKVRQP